MLICKTQVQSAIRVGIDGRLLVKNVVEVGIFLMASLQ